MRNNLVSLLLLLVCATNVYSQTNDSSFIASSVSSVLLLNPANQSSFRINLSLHKPVLFIFLSPECPLCRNYSSTLNILYQQYKNEVAFYGIIPGKAYSVKDVRAFQTTYQIQFPLLIDSNKQLTSYLHATATPEVILLNETFNLMYKGAVDNWIVGLGKQRVKPTQFYLKNAIDESLDHNNVVVKRTKAIGCKINDF